MLFLINFIIKKEEGEAAGYNYCDNSFYLNNQCWFVLLFSEYISYIYIHHAITLDNYTLDLEYFEGSVRGVCACVTEWVRAQIVLGVAIGIWTTEVTEVVPIIDSDTGGADKKRGADKKQLTFLVLLCIWMRHFKRSGVQGYLSVYIL